MSKKYVCVETKRYAPAIPILDALAKACEFLGYEVIRWDDRSKFPSEQFELGIIWNTFDRGGKREFIECLHKTLPLVFIENGWLLQKTSFQLDNWGINGLASWMNEEIPCSTYSPLTIDKNGKILVIMQSDEDSNFRIKELSPYFRYNIEFLNFLDATIDYPMVIRKHPLYPPLYGAVEFVNNNSKMSWDKSTTLQDAMSDAQIVCTINSTSGVEAIYYGKSVLMYGNNVYKQKDVVYVCDDDKEKTKNIISDLQDGQCSLNRLKQLLFIKKILEKQWYINQLPYRLGLHMELFNIIKKG